MIVPVLKWRRPMSKSTVKAKYIEETELVLQHLQTHGRATKSELLRRYMRILDITSLEAVMTVLKSMNVVGVIIKPGQDTIYEYREKGAEVIPFRQKKAT